jgi:hypothetical protein
MADDGHTKYSDFNCHGLVFSFPVFAALFCIGFSGSRSQKGRFFTAARRWVVRPRCWIFSLTASYSEI